MTHEILSKAKIRLNQRRQEIVRGYLAAKGEGRNITEWKFETAETMGISIHTIDHYLRPARLHKIVEQLNAQS